MDKPEYTGMKPFKVEVLEKSDAQKLQECRKALGASTLREFKMLQALEKIARTPPGSMVNDSEALRHAHNQLTQIAENVLKEIRA